jgi:hypothetical protein
MYIKHIHLYGNNYIYMHTLLMPFLHTWTYTYLHIHMCVPMVYINAHTPMFAYTYTHTHIHKCTHTHAHTTPMHSYAHVHIRPTHTQAKKQEYPIEDQAAKSLKRRPCRGPSRQMPKNDDLVEGQAVKSLKLDDPIDDHGRQEQTNDVPIGDMAAKSRNMRILSRNRPPGASSEAPVEDQTVRRRK